MLSETGHMGMCLGPALNEMTDSGDPCGGLHPPWRKSGHWVGGWPARGGRGGGEGEGAGIDV